MPEAVIVVPCFDEERRLDVERCGRFAESGALGLLLVDDGSRDGTRRVLETIATRCRGSVEVLALPRNRGKAEAVWAGLLHALERGASIVGYTDADASTPHPELVRPRDELERRGADMALGACVALLGRTIERTWTRHYLGRVFATVASLILRMPLYDTQCGAKVLRVTPALRAALAEPFLSRWAFDVELIGRLHCGTAAVPGIPLDAFVEVPLAEWRHVPGGRLRFAGTVRVLGDLARIARDLPRRRAALRVR